MPSLAHLDLQRPGRASQLWSRALDGGIVAEAGALHPSLPLDCSGYVSAVEGVLVFYPIDSRLSGLARAASGPGTAQVLRRSLGARLGLATTVSEVELVRYKPGKRAVFRYSLREAAVSEIYAKLRSDDRSAVVTEVADAWGVAGIPTPRPLGYLADLRMLVSERGRGTRLKDLRGTIEYEGWMEPVAEVLDRLHSAAVDPTSPLADNEERDEVLASGAIVGALLPQLADDANRLAGELASDFGSVAGPTTGIHGSFHDDQVLVSEAGVVVVDLDSARVGDPASDVGHFAAYLTADGADASRDRFLEACARLRPDPGGRFLLWEAASLLRWATLPFRELQHDWPEAVEHRVRAAAVRLRKYRSHGRPGARAARTA